MVYFQLNVMAFFLEFQFVVKIILLTSVVLSIATVWTFDVFLVSARYQACSVTGFA